MKVLAVFHDNNLNSGATKSFLSNILYMNNQEDINIVAVVPKKDGNLIDLLKKHNIKTFQLRYGGNVYGVKKKWLNNFVSYCRCLIKTIISYLNSRKFELILHNLSIDAVYSNTSTIYFGAWIARRMKINHYWHFREFNLEDQNSCHIFPRMFNELMNMTNCIFTISKTLDNYYKNKYGLLNTIVLYNDISKDYINLDKEKHRKINILVTGTLCENKGQLFVIKTLQNKDNIMLYIAGKVNDYGHILESYIENNSIRNVKMCGLVTDMKELRKKIDVSIVAASSEAFGRTIIEDMLSSILVIGCDRGAVPELISNYKTGLLYKYMSSEDLIRKIEWVIENKAENENIRKNAFEYALKFTEERTAKEVYNYIVNGKNCNC